MQEAEQQLIADLHFYRQAGARRQAAIAIAGLAACHAAQGHPLRAAQLWGAAEAIRTQIGALQWPCDAQAEKSRIAIAQAQTTPKQWAAAWSAGGMHSWEQTVDRLLSRAHPIFS